MLRHKMSHKVKSPVSGQWKETGRDLTLDNWPGWLAASPNLNEKIAFHGASKVHPQMIALTKEGFMTEYARDGFYGRALYFAERPCYSHSRARWVEQGDGQTNPH